MATEIRVPTLGESVTEATIGRWFKQKGDSLNVDEAVVELETDKVTLEVPAPAGGMLQEIMANEGDTVAVGALLGLIAEGAGASAAEAKPAGKPVAAAAASEATDDVSVSPAAAKMIAEEGLDASSIEGSGKRGQILKGDVIEALEKGTVEKVETVVASPVPAPQPAPKPAAPAPIAAPVAARAPSSAGDAAREERIRMTRLRQTIAQRLKDAQNTAAMLTTFNEVDRR